MEADKYLGILLTRLDDGSIKMQQPKLLTALFDEFADELSKTKKKKVTAPTSSQSLINIKSTTSTSIFKHNNNTIIFDNNDSENRNNNILLKKKYVLGTLMYAAKS
jgi:predicted secreted Zn-dependent protease